MYSVIDIGSNTVRLVIYQVEEDGRIRPMLNNKRAAGLAGYVDAEGSMRRDGVERLIGILQEFQQILELLPDCTVFPFATASLRNIKNTDEVLEQIRQRCGLEVQVLSGREEAMLDFRGAIRMLGRQSGVMADVGGGSTEVVFFRDGRVQAAGSIALGSLNLYRRYCGDIFPTEKELNAMQKEIRSALSSALPSVKELRTSMAVIPEPLCAIGGSARGLLSLYRQSHGSEAVSYPADYLQDLLERSRTKPKKLLRQMLQISPDRVHTLLPGALLLSTIAEMYGSRTILTSQWGVREGYLESKLEAETK